MIASSSITRPPEGSAAVARINATSSGSALYHSQVLPPISTRSTSASVVRAFSRPPDWSGSMKVPRPTCVMQPGRPAAMSRNRWQITPWGKL